jgi:hypothetical protein
VALPVPADNGLGLFIAQVPDPLLALQVELAPVAFVTGVDEAEGMATERSGSAAAVRRPLEPVVS